MAAAKELTVNGSLGQTGSTYDNILKNEVGMVAENEMKVDAIEPSQNNFDFSNGDKLVNFSLSNNKKVDELMVKRSVASMNKNTMQHSFFVLFFQKRM